MPSTMQGIMGNKKSPVSQALREASRVCDECRVPAVAAESEAGGLSCSSEGYRFRGGVRGELQLRPGMFCLQKMLL